MIAERTASPAGTNVLIMLSQAASAKLDGIVGSNFLRNYRVVIDYPNELFRLE